MNKLYYFLKWLAADVAASATSRDAMRLYRNVHDILSFLSYLTAGVALFFAVLLYFVTPNKTDATFYSLKCLAIFSGCALFWLASFVFIKYQQFNREQARIVSILQAK